ncbi:MAG: PIG-L family deacetylase, partial [bacterium]|nr:PIG-L family deacetylase [bacterium]MDW8164800.1 PIG-L family deacetylase [Candidatus Omnitrophota bacterium]
MIKENEKIIIFAPHPDDEILGCAGLIQKIINNMGKVYIVYLTNGDHNQIPYRIYEKKIILNPIDYIKLGEIRRKESIEATRSIKINEKDLIFLGYPDFGTLKIWENYWREDDKPFKSFLTRASYVPYKESYSFGKPYVSKSILDDIEKIIKEIKPTKIFITSNYDTNVDHRALYNFVRIALLEIQEIKPEVFIYLIHFKNYPQRNSEKLLILNLPSVSEWYNISLDNKEIQKKKVAIECFKSQMVFRKNWFMSFAKENEVFYKEIDVTLDENL